MPTPWSAPGSAGFRLESCMVNDGCTGAGWPGWAKAAEAEERDQGSSALRDKFGDRSLTVAARRVGLIPSPQTASRQRSLRHSKLHFAFSGCAAATADRAGPADPWRDRSESAPRPFPDRPSRSCSEPDLPPREWLSNPAPQLCCSCGWGNALAGSRGRHLGTSRRRAAFARKQIPEQPEQQEEHCHDNQRQRDGELAHRPHVDVGFFVTGSGDVCWLFSSMFQSLLQVRIVSGISGRFPNWMRKYASQMPPRPIGRRKIHPAQAERAPGGSPAPPASRGPPCA